MIFHDKHNLTNMYCRIQNVISRPTVPHGYGLWNAERCFTTNRTSRIWIVECGTLFYDKQNLSTDMDCGIRNAISRQTEPHEYGWWNTKRCLTTNRTSGRIRIEEYRNVIEEKKNIKNND